MLQSGMRLLAVVILAGCTPPLAMTEGPVTARAVAVPGIPTVGSEIIEIRTRVGRDEVAGAICEVRSAFHIATLTSPGTVAIPEYGRASPDLVVTCTQGVLRGVATSEIEDTRDADERSAVSLRTDGKDVGLGLRLVLPLTRPDPAKIYDYPDVTVQLR